MSEQKVWGREGQREGGRDSEINREGEGDRQEVRESVFRGPRICMQACSSSIPLHPIIGSCSQRGQREETICDWMIVPEEVCVLVCLCVYFCVCV